MLGRIPQKSLRILRELLNTQGLHSDEAAPTYAACVNANSKPRQTASGSPQRSCADSPGKPTAIPGGAGMLCR